MGNPGGGILEEGSWKRNPGRGILEQESSRKNPGGGVLKEEPWMRNPQGGIPEVESWGRNPARRILNKDYLRRNLRVGILEEAPWKTPGNTSREPWRDIQGPSGATKDLPEATGTTFWAERKSVLKPLCFSAKSDATECFVCTGARRHARSTVPAHTSWPS